MWSRRPRDEHGAAAVEGALITLLLFTVMIGILEMSLLMRDAGAASSSVRAGTRVAAAAASAGPCDMTKCGTDVGPALGQAAAVAVARASEGLPKGSIQWLMVYDATATGFPEGGTDYSACTTRCVRYTWDSATGKFFPPTGSWDTKQVNACVNHANRQSIGVALNARHGFVTELFGSGVPLTERNVMVFEPLPNDACLPGEHG